VCMCVWCVCVCSVTWAIAPDI